MYINDYEVYVGGSKIGKIVMNDKVLYELNSDDKEFAIEYTIEVRNTSDSISSYYTYSSTNYYYYLPLLYTDDTTYSISGYDKIEITKTDGTITDDVTTLASDVEKIKLWYPESTPRISFYGYSATCPCYITTILNSKKMNTANLTSMQNMFIRCTKLKSLDASNWDTSNVTTMRSAFNECSTLTSLDLSNWDTSNVTNMYAMFCYCSNLTSLDLSNWDTSNVNDMYKMFSSCSSLTSLDLSNWDTSNVTSYSDMFSSVPATVDWHYVGINYAKWTLTESQTSYSYVFPWNIIQASSITLNTYSVDLTDNGIDIYASVYPENATSWLKWTCDSEFVSLAQTKDGSSCRLDTGDVPYDISCTVTVTSIDNPNISAHVSVTCSAKQSKFYIEYTVDNTSTYALNAYGTTSYYYCLPRVYSTSSNYTYKYDRVEITLLDGTTTDDLNTTCDNVSKVKLWYPSNTYAIKFYGSYSYRPVIKTVDYIKIDSFKNFTYMFYYCSSLTSVNVSNWDTSNVTNTSYMFYYCSSLTSLDVSNWDTSNVTTMYSMFYYCSSLTSLDVSNFDTSSVTSMYGMFFSCSSLTSLDVSNFDTSKVTNMQNIFSNCTSLTSLDVSNFDTSSVTSMYGMFSSCSSLTSLDVSNFDTSSVTSMYQMFGYCKLLTSLDVSNFDTSKVTSMNSTFSNCTSLTSLDVSNFDTSNVTNMGSMFYNCSSLTSLDVSNFNTSNVTSMSGMFRSCSSLTSLDLSNFNTSNVTSMDNMFTYCSLLTSLDLSNFNTSKVTNMYMMFYNCSSLTSLDLSNFDTSKVTKMSIMFSSVPTTVDLHYDGTNYTNWTLTESDTNYSGTFPWNKILVESITLDMESIDLSNGPVTVTATVLPEDATNREIAWSCENTNINIVVDGLSATLSVIEGISDDIETSLIVTSTDGSSISTSIPVVYYSAKEFAIEYTIEVRNTSDKVNSYYTSSSTDYYYYLPRIYTDSSTWTVTGYDKIEITKKDGTTTTSLSTKASDVEKIKIWYPKDTTYNIRFYGYSSTYQCYVNSILNADRMDTSNLTSLTYMFYNCMKLTSLDASSWDTGKVTNMSGMFYYCSSLKSLDVSNFNTSSVTNMSNMFDGCSSLKSLDLSNWDTSNLKSLTYMFYNCKSLTSLDASSWDTGKVTHMTSMFYGCSKLTSLNLSNWDTGKVAVMSSMFSSVPTTVDWHYNGDNYSNWTLEEYETGYSGSFPWNEAYIEYTIAPLDNSYISEASYSDHYYYLPRIYKSSSSYSKPTASDVLITKKDGTTTTSLSTLSSDVKKIKVFYNKNNLYKFSFYGYTETKMCRVKDILKVKNCIKTNLNNMFRYCTLLNSLDVSSFDTSKVTNMSYMFYYCGSLTSLNLSSFDTSKVTNMSYMFTDFTSLRSLNLSSWDNSKVTNMSYMFRKCSSLTSLNLSNFNTSNVTNMQGIFQHCSKLTSLNLSNFDTSNVTDMSYMFENCKSLTSLDLSSWDTSKVTSKYGMFSLVPSTCKIYVGPNWTLTESGTSFSGTFTRVK